MLSDKLLLKIFGAASIAFIAATLVRLFYLQVLHYDFYDKLVSVQSTARISFSKDRGLILDRSGKNLAINQKMASLYLFGKNIEDADDIIASLKKSGIELAPLTEKRIRDKTNFIWIERKLPIAKAEKIKESVGGGLNYVLEDARLYPENSMLAGVIGTTGTDNQGLSGIEYFKEKILRAKLIPANIIRDSRDKLIIFDDAPLRTEPDSAIFLTVDTQLQAVIDILLAQDMAEYKAKRAIALAMNIKTGEILAYSGISADKSEADKNLMSTFLFEPGSIFKGITFGYLIEKGLYRAGEKVNTSAAVDLYGHKIKDVYIYNSLTQQDIFAKSSNIGTVQLTRNVGSEAFYKFMVHCGFGVKTGIDGVSEEGGILREPKNWSGLSLASLSIGQEIMVTPLQIVRYYAAIGNNGIAVKPRIIGKYIENGSEYPSKTESVQIMSPQTAKTLLNLLATVVDKGTGKRAKSAIVNIGGKTGTGQVADPATKSYSKTDYIASFAGVFPANDPKVAMIVLFDSPRSSIYGGETGAVSFRKIAEQIAFFYNLGSEKTRVYYAHR
ncbi:MAG: penicillin-binding protein 2 [Deferribacteraceae bacterium]|jgi:cell division protein FtsI (penicillin-binding protein 3)|nr:penicillin-binding protein 2 [Deferribacteraceae bacterium]